MESKWKLEMKTECQLEQLRFDVGLNLISKYMMISKI